MQLIFQLVDQDSRGNVTINEHEKINSNRKCKSCLFNKNNIHEHIEQDVLLQPMSMKR
jgi:hypothetical protein